MKMFLGYKVGKYLTHGKVALDIEIIVKKCKTFF
jgi:hypothetical protein